ncbi:conserved hypothetical protein [Dinoroseobacter shibae DFL 12 = DSM 16493]|jgi:hypothetical protein|uniref:Transmembrane protein n=1 Tax=Dinoroseobacter shibae (strain DSM 16493 / NCIMB 14021 / DFL 12) TaxID=398580 RepID=A8LJC7_DINSH|nr:MULTISPECIES: hypothetical protein [Dinoroseobacter]ABV93149.1 conserved hypothetical protein [Dinoroseobacter shibae DFL 12 = DSM 16493]MDD9715759.1 hypothetical protein [Dinoroseobacter sp. PD6]URF48074.1 hypothetical protein M8008_07260 [Dinoroseobacter shibae]URF52384.1 hypothetical protein M8007_07260 [Dinoroseobacter shibae]
MARGRPPLFLQPEPYRKRRLIDAARLLPVFGTFLFVVPMLLLPRDEPGTTGEALIYLFVLWTLLIVFSALINRYIRRAERANLPAPGFTVSRRQGDKGDDDAGGGA